MKNKKQEKLCQLVEAFCREMNGENFQLVLNELFRCPLLFPVGKGDKKGQFLMVEREGAKHMAGFTDMEEVQKGNMEEVDFLPFTLEEYAQVMSDVEEIKGLVINIFNEKNCVINREFFANVVTPAFKSRSVMPGLETVDGTIIPITKMPFCVGRNEKADMRLSSNTINNIHAFIIEKDNHYYVVDKNSLNGTYVNGKEVEKGGELEIVFDDIIEFCDESYTFVPVGLANRQQREESIYGDDKQVIVNGVFFAQNSLLMQEFFTNQEEFIQAVKQDENKKYFQQFLLMGIEMTCAMIEKEQKIEDEAVIKEQRILMLRKGMTIFNRDDYGFSKIDCVGADVYVAKFPAYMHVQGMSKHMYFVTNGKEEPYILVVKIEQDKCVLTKVKGDHTEDICGDISNDAIEELKTVMQLIQGK